MCIPRIFWNPKLHKNPYKARFIAGASNCTTKQLSILVNLALKVLRKYFSKYCTTIYRNTGIDCDWSINNSAQFLKKLNRLPNVFNLQVYDFTTLYTNLELEVVQHLLNEIIDIIFNTFNKYICVSQYKNNCFFAKKQYNGYVCFSATNLKSAMQFLLQNTYVSFGGIVLRQTRGIPMGGNSSSQFADLSLAKSEFNFMLNIIKEKKFNLAKLLSNNSRYVDDLCVVNYLHFHNLISKIYPIDLKMERSGDDNKIINYLDIRINICDSNFNTEIYNKLDDFDFPVVMYTFPNGNMPLSVGYNVFYSQVIRYYNIHSQIDGFISSTNRLYKILVNRSYDSNTLQSKFKVLLRNKPEILLKYQIFDLNEIIDDLFKL